MNTPFKENTRVSTTAIQSQFGTGSATDCWIIKDNGGDTVIIGYGHDEYSEVPRSSILLKQKKEIKRELTDSEIVEYLSEGCASVGFGLMGLRSYAISNKEDLLDAIWQDRLDQEIPT